MADPVGGARAGLRACVLPASLIVAGAILTLVNLHGTLHHADWSRILDIPAGDDIRVAIVRLALLPRLVASIGAGAALGLSSVFFQQALRNPLAEPATLGTSAGAQLALSGATFYAPGLLAIGPDWIALAGAFVATAFVFTVAGDAPVALILAGLVIAFLCSTLSDLLAILHMEDAVGIFIWSSGTLSQNDWGVVLGLLPRIGAVTLLSGFLVRPLAVLSLDDAAARSLGLSPRAVRLLSLGIAIVLAAFVTAALGVIGFVGLAATNVARASGARDFRRQILWAPLYGALLLWLADQGVQCLGTTMGGLPTGVATAVLGAPLLLWMLPRLRAVRPASARDDPAPRARQPALLVACLVLLVVVAAALALALGDGPHGWAIDTSWGARAHLLWRWPRVLASMAAGAMLAVAGTILQRMTGNVMASPEILGVSSGASFGVILLVLSGASPDRMSLIVAATAGACSVLLILLLTGRRSGSAPERMLLAGIALTTVFSAFVTLLLASGDPRSAMLLSWLSGSTEQVGPSDALTSAGLCGVLLLPVALTLRWLGILPLGRRTARSVGVDPGRVTPVLLLVTAALTASGTVIVGPIGFVGLIAPHLARTMGLQRPADQLAGAALLGALILVVADWAGRNLLYPYQLPAGLLATLVGAPCFLWLMRKRTDCR